MANHNPEGRLIDFPTDHTLAKSDHMLNVRETHFGAEADQSLSWVGDNICQATDKPILIELAEPDGTPIYASVASTFILLHRIKADERHRILTALRNCAERGELNAADTRAYRTWEREQAGEATGDQSSAALDVNKVTCLLHTLQWAGKKCEDAHDYEQFHALALELVPRLGATLEHAVADLGQVCTGLFEEARHV